MTRQQFLAVQQTGNLGNMISPSKNKVITS